MTKRRVTEDLMRIVLVLAFLALAGCESPQLKYQRRIQNFVGHTEEEVIQEMGAPDQTYQSGKTKFLTYQTNAGSQGIILDSGIMVNHARTCKTTFTIAESLEVAAVKAEGRGCGR